MGRRGPARFFFMNQFTGSYKKYNIRGTNVHIYAAVDKKAIREMAKNGMFEDLVQVGLYDVVFKKKVVVRRAKGKTETDEDMDS